MPDKLLFKGKTYIHTNIKQENGEVGIVSFYVALEEKAEKIVVKTPIDDDDLNLTEWKQEEKAWNIVYAENPCELVADNNSVMLIMPYLGKNTLRKTIEKTTAFENQLRLYINVAETLQNMHIKKVAHNDIKDRNIVIGSEANPYQAYFIDFGKSSSIDSSDDILADIAGFCLMILFHEEKKKNSFLKNKLELNRIIGLGRRDQYRANDTLSIIIAALKYELAIELKDQEEVLELISQVINTPNLEKYEKELFSKALHFKKITLKNNFPNIETHSNGFFNSFEEKQNKPNVADLDKDNLLLLNQFSFLTPSVINRTDDTIVTMAQSSKNLQSL